MLHKDDAGKAFLHLCKGIRPGDPAGPFLPCSSTVLQTLSLATSQPKGPE